MGITLSDRERRFIALFEEETGATARDCIVDEDGGRVVFVVAVGEMRTAIGPDGRTVKGVEERLGSDVRLVEDADTPEAFVANALAPAAVYGVELEGDGTTVARADVADGDEGAAIGRGGRNIEVARRLAKRHFDIDDIQLA
jgi:N utilization substance protein A